jgi:hypothetical protein
MQCRNDVKLAAAETLQLAFRSCDPAHAAARRGGQQTAKRTISHLRLDAPRSHVMRKFRKMARTLILFNAR